MEGILEHLQAQAALHPPSLPLKLLVIADCAGQDAGEIARADGGVEGLLQKLKPVLKLAVENKLQPGGAKIAVNLEIRSLGDFQPAALVSRLEILSEAAGTGQPALGHQLDEILHHPEFQRMEACWLGLERLCGALGDHQALQLEVLPATRKSLVDRFHKSVFEPEYSGSVETALSAVYFDFRFSHEPADLPLLAALAEDCAALQVTLIASVHPGFFQLKNLAHLPNLPDIAGKLQLPAYANWRRFQTGPTARWTCLTTNRFLARELHNLSKDSGSGWDYQEQADAAHPERYLWADAGWLVMCNLANSFAKYRHCVVIDGMNPDAVHRNLPVRPFPKKANVMTPSPTEILIDDEKAWDIVKGGVTVLVGISDGAVATFPLIANVYRLRNGVLTTESALSYQLFAGHLAHYLMALCAEIPSGIAPEAAVALARERLQEFLVPFCGDAPENSVQVSATEIPGDPPRRALNLVLKPAALKIQSKDVEFTLQLAL
jgi:type VI secretion system ImpC/EvpB family protein